MKTEPTSRAVVTQQDIAQHLGVSRSWVARALGGDPKITQHSRQRVVAASMELGYDAHQNREARIMAGRRNARRVRFGAIGYVPHATGSQGHLGYWMQLQSGIHDALRDTGLELMLLRPDSMQSWEKVDGVLVHSEDAPQLYRKLPVAIPFVSVMLPLEGIPSVSPDEASGVLQSVQHLVALGHRRIGHLIHCRISHPEIESITPIEQRRQEAYTDALQHFGITPRPEWICNLENCGDFVERGRDSMQGWIRSGFQESGCTALLVQNDRAAIGAMEALHHAGIHVPEDLSLIGFDSTSECLLARPHLTSVSTNLHGIGGAAVDHLLRQIRGEAGPDQVMVLPSQLVVRASTAPPSQPASGKSASTGIGGQ